MKKCLVLGFFDGVHKGHRKVVESALECSDDVEVITLKDSPSLFFDGKIEYIMSRKNSLHKLKKFGIKEILELDFSNVVSISAEKYLSFIVERYQPSYICTGFNHTFGYNKSGNVEFLKCHEKKYNYKYICIPPVVENGEIVSSTLIKKYLSEGKIEQANSLLESNFILEGKVVHGAKIGRTIGFPTANINYPDELVKIPFGVYKARINIDKYSKLPAIMNWGMKPTVNNTVEPIVEVHILNFNDNLYNKKIEVEVLKQIRGEKKFNNLEELKTQIQKDVKRCSEL